MKSLQKSFRLTVLDTGKSIEPLRVVTHQSSSCKMKVFPAAVMCSSCSCAPTVHLSAQQRHLDIFCKLQVMHQWLLAGTAPANACWLSAADRQQLPCILTATLTAVHCRVMQCTVILGQLHCMYVKRSQGYLSLPVAVVTQGGAEPCQTSGIGGKVAPARQEGCPTQQGRAA